MSSRVWTEADVRALGLTTDITTASSVLGMSRGTGYRLVREGRFPVRTIPNDRHSRVPVLDLLRVLGLEPPLADLAGEPRGLRAV
ncbi:MAG: hypothetical protein JWL79_3081 [Frankiales bacterium]|nr:hypothetical protein [Frankiales bacterium]